MVRSDGLKEEFQGCWRAWFRLWIGGSGHGEKGRAKLGRANRADAILCVRVWFCTIPPNLGGGRRGKVGSGCTVACATGASEARKGKSAR